MQGHHPLKVQIDLRRNASGKYDLQQLEVSGIVIGGGIYKGVNLDELDKQMSRVNWKTRYDDPKEWPGMDPVMKALNKIEKYPLGREIGTRLFLKYMDTAYRADVKPSYDHRRAQMERRMVINLDGGKVVKVKEACQLFVGTSIGPMPARLLHGPMEEPVREHKGRSKSR